MNDRQQSCSNLRRDQGHWPPVPPRPFFRPLESPRRLVAVWLAVAVLLTLTALTGCAALPMPLQPKTDDNSNSAEGAYIVLTALDTAQTMHIRKGTSCDHEANPVMAWAYGSKYPKPGRVLLTNLVTLTVHTMVASWLDDEVDAHKSDRSADWWYAGRITFHAVGLIGKSAAVANNSLIGCKL